MGTPPRTQAYAYNSQPVDEEARKRLKAAGDNSYQAATGTNTAVIGNLSPDSLDQLAEKKGPKPGIKGATPDFTDDLVRQAREWQALNTKARRGHASTFLTGPKVK